ncbi:MAG TPA: S53 family peptidase [Candidatus Baltobacteraceae bacterium]|nr:S53 family peptidase [Candidatus Baltobacteraceae bacterium]
MLHKFARPAALIAVASLLAACSGGGSIPVTQSLPGGTATQATTAASCATLLPGDNVRCFALYRTDIGGNPAVGTGGRSVMGHTTNNATPAGYGPADIQSAYALPSATAGSGQTVAIVDAYDDPYAENDLGVYRAQFGLPSCTTANGCFKKVNQSGGSKMPRSNGGWGQEISLDLDMVSATCPNCHILLVEASSASFSNLGAAVNTAVQMGANVVSNSYGGSESSATNSAYNHPGHIITASAGDNGTGASQPCSFATVVCVGGTSLSRASSTRGWSESAWSGSGSGCSAQVAKPSWQTDSGCTMRSEADTSAVADPNTGVAVYDSFAYQGQSGWMVFGGTSVSSPLIASVYALAGNAASMNYAQSIWQHGGTTSLNDVTSGSNGTCSISYICNAGPGYDGPTGWGTPSGTGAF